MREPCHLGCETFPDLDSKCADCRDDAIRKDARYMIIMRGLPGSGKSYDAKCIANIMENEDDVAVLSTDDFFCQSDGEYVFDANEIGTAHRWNQQRAIDAAKEGVRAIIIDNTNTQAWEMLPYVRTAMTYGYKVHLKRASSYWRDDPAECFKRCRHGVPRSVINNMAEQFEFGVSVEDIINSKAPWE